MAQGDISPRRTENAPASRRELSPFDLLPRMFSDFFASGFPELFTTRQQASMFLPKVNIDENENQIKICAELPGMSENDIEIIESRDGVTIRGEKKEEKKEGNGGRQYKEFSYGAFERFIPIDADVDESKAKATFDKGILELVLPKTEDSKSKTRKIKIEAAG